MVISFQSAANVSIINLPMTLGNLPIAANGLPLVPIGNYIQVWFELCLSVFNRKQVHEKQEVTI